jgi:hypothetical protein
MWIVQRLRSQASLCAASAAVPSMELLEVLLLAAAPSRRRRKRRKKKLPQRSSKALSLLWGYLAVPQGQMGEVGARLRQVGRLLGAQVCAAEQRLVLRTAVLGMIWLTPRRRQGVLKQGLARVPALSLTLGAMLAHLRAEGRAEGDTSPGRRRTVAMAAAQGALLLMEMLAAMRAVEAVAEEGLWMAALKAVSAGE